MTMANSTVASPMRSGASLRKTNKPLMEKRRRARINDSLSQLKSLVITGTKKDSSQFNKLEKADILELTVKHLRNLQNHHQQHHQQQQQPQLVGSDPALGPRYQDGFIECANEVIRYLGQAQGFTDDTKCRVINHLASCIQLANTKAKVMQAGVLAAGVQAAVNTNRDVKTSAPSTAILGGGFSASAGVPTQGQIIQIVSAAPAPPPPAPAAGKPQNVHILPSPTAPTVVKNSIKIAAPHSTSGPACSATSIPVQQLHTPHYAQPLHIQIPPAFSPVLIGKADAPNRSRVAQKPQQQQQQHQPMDIAPRPDVTETSPARFAPTDAFLSGKSLKQQQQQQSECGVLPATPDSTPSPQHLRACQSPAIPIPGLTRQQQQQQQPDTPITHVHKIHGFYSSAEDFVPARPRTFSMTSSSSSASSASSSSSENELASPLNLCQSPPHYRIGSRRLGKGGESAPKPRHFMDKNNNNTNTGLVCNINTSYSSMICTSNQENISSIGNTIFHSDISMHKGEGYSPSHPLSSVMVNGRKAIPEAPAFKYVSMMMEDDRQCTRNHGHRSRSTSPASSVGEDRLWRPW